MGKKALPFTSTRPLQKLLLQLLTVCLQNWSSSHVFLFLESSGFQKADHSHCFSASLTPLEQRWLLWQREDYLQWLGVELCWICFRESSSPSLRFQNFQKWFVAAASRLESGIITGSACRTWPASSKVVVSCRRFIAFLTDDLQKFKSSQIIAPVSICISVKNATNLQSGRIDWELCTTWSRSTTAELQKPESLTWETNHCTGESPSMLSFSSINPGYP